MKNKLLLAALMLFGAHALPSTAAETPASAPLLLVQVTHLNAIGPDGQPYTLYQDNSGQITPMQDLGRIAYFVKAGTLPEGGYHTLSVRLTDEATAIYGDGHQEARSLKTMSLPDEKRISGMLWVEAGNVTPMRVSPRRYPARYKNGADDD